MQLTRVANSCTVVNRSCSKPALVRGLWRDHHDNPAVVRLISQLMLDFKVNDGPLWVAVLGQGGGNAPPLIPRPPSGSAGGSRG